MNTRRIEQVMSKTGLKRATIYKWVGEGRFPRPFKLNGTVTVWDDADIDLWLMQQKQGDKIEAQ